MRVMGFDVGDKTLGVAVSDPTGLIAQGLTTLRRQGGQEMQAVKELLQQYQVEGIVVGLPLNTNGTSGPQAAKTREWGRRLSEESGLPVVFWDERLSTVAAERVLLEGDISRRKRRKVIDKLAASIILQSYLDRRRLDRQERL
ncbi:MAG: Holliday junction resolvase RuvX [Clostridia bacterium]|nr:MAG: Holliday junction resolvase RuvX [Clostridia bacterium]